MAGLCQEDKGELECAQEVGAGQEGQVDAEGRVFGPATAEEEEDGHEVEESVGECEEGTEEYVEQRGDVEELLHL